MRIHCYLPEFPPAGDKLNSGMIKAVHGLAVGLVQNGAKVTILCYGPQQQIVQSVHGYEIRSYSESGVTMRRSSQLPRALERYIDECDEPGVFILNGVFNPHVYMISAACKRNRIPYIVAPHDPYHPSIFATRKHLKWPYWYLRERPMLREARAVQVLDLRHAEWLRAYGVHTPVIEVVNGYAAEDLHSLDVLSWRTSGPPRLLYMGRMDSHNKGLDLLLEAFSQLTSQTDAQLTLQGPDWGDRGSLIRLSTKLGLGARVSFRDPDFNKPSALIAAEHDVFLLPSRFEGFGLSALEAMLAGRTILVSDVAGLSPHVRASGCGVVISSDVASIKAGFLELLARRDRWKEMGIAGREYALKNLRWDHIAANALQQYRALLKLPTTTTASTTTIAAAL